VLPCGFALARWAGSLIPARGRPDLARLPSVPGWYSGRAVHIHFKVRTNPASNTGTEFTSQLFFDDDLSAEIFTTWSLYSEKGTQDVTNDHDNIFADSNGQLTLSLTPDGDGYAATLRHRRAARLIATAMPPGSRRDPLGGTGPAARSTRPSTG
jgi:hypothetical protein